MVEGTSSPVPSNAELQEAHLTPSSLLCSVMRCLLSLPFMEQFSSLAHKRKKCRSWHAQKLTWHSGTSAIPWSSSSESALLYREMLLVSQNHCIPFKCQIFPKSAFQTPKRCWFRIPSRQWDPMTSRPTSSEVLTKNRGKSTRDFPQARSFLLPRREHVSQAQEVKENGLLALGGCCVR